MIDRHTHVLVDLDDLLDRRRLEQLGRDALLDCQHDTLSNLDTDTSATELYSWSHNHNDNNNHNDSHTRASVLAIVSRVRNSVYLSPEKTRHTLMASMAYSTW